MSDLIIAGMRIMPGERKYIEVPIAQLPAQTMLKMPLVVKRSKCDGPILWISSAVHGDEINGVEIIHRMLEYVKNHKLRGTLIAVPIVNIFGFTHQSRYLPDRRDLNRSFPGGRKGSLAARLAHLFLTEVVEKATHGIDIHTGAIHRPNYIHARCDSTLEASLDLARNFSPPIILTKKSGAGTLRAAASKMGKPNILIELGEALRFHEGYIEECVQGLLRVMNHLGMIDEKPIYPVDKPLETAETVWIRARRGGLFRTAVRLGDRVKKSQNLGIVTDVHGESQGKIVAPKPGLVIGLLENPLVYQGDALIHIAVL